jgi:hypothetical protein
MYVKFCLSDDLIADVHSEQGHIELMDTKRSEDIRLDFEGVHFIANGTIYGFAEANG